MADEPRGRKLRRGIIAILVLLAIGFVVSIARDGGSGTGTQSTATGQSPATTEQSPTTAIAGYGGLPPKYHGEWCQVSTQGSYAFFDLCKFVDHSRVPESRRITLSENRMLIKFPSGNINACDLAHVVPDFFGTNDRGYDRWVVYCVGDGTTGRDTLRLWRQRLGAHGEVEGPGLVMERMPGGDWDRSFRDSERYQKDAERYQKRLEDAYKSPRP